MNTLTIQQVQEMGRIQPNTLLSDARIAELNSLIAEGYPASAIVCAIRESAYAARNNIVIPPTMMTLEGN